MVILSLVNFLLPFYCHVFCFPSSVFEWEAHVCMGPLHIEERVRV